MKHVRYILLSICLSLPSTYSFAIESLVDGASVLTPNDDITGTTPDELLCQPVTLPANTGTWQCAVTASAEAINPLSGDDNRYIFGLSVTEGTTCGNPPSTDPGSDRTIDFDRLDTSEETDRVVVTTTFVFRISSTTPRNERVFHFSARKEASGDANMTVDDSSISVMCSDNEG